MKKRTLTAIALLLITAASAPAQILWDENGVAIRQASDVNWWGGWAVKNDNGDLYAVWQEWGDLMPKVYAQKFNVQGASLWANPAEVITGPILQMSNCVEMDICSTSDGGLAVAWATFVGYVGAMVHVQKVDADGNVQWPVGGVTVGRCLYESGDGGQKSPDPNRGGFSYFNVVGDSSGGAFAVWVDLTGSNYIELFANHVEADGSIAPGWNPHGNVIQTNVAYQGEDFCKFVCSDDAGGFIVGWQHEVAFLPYKNFAQRVDGAGNRLWGNHGLLICQYGSLYAYPRPARDEYGGAFFAWQDTRGVDIYAQRVNNQGIILWLANGVPAIQAPGSQDYPKIVEDDFGGALIACQDARNGNPDVYGQRIDDSGNLLWASSGVAITAAAGTQEYFDIAADGMGGLFADWVSWTAYAHLDAYVQHITPQGQAGWQINGIPLRTGNDKSVGFVAVEGAIDGAALAVWSETRGNREGVYLQKADVNGAFLLGPTGQPIIEALFGEAEDFQLTALNSDRFLTIWTDTRNNQVTGRLICYQITDLDGIGLLPENGVPICTLTNDDQKYSKAAAAPDGGAIITWRDWRNGVVNARVYAQRIDDDGNALWQSDGVAVNTTDVTQVDQQVCSDEVGGAYVLWRNYGNNLLIQRLDANGTRLFGDSGFYLTTSSEEPDALVADGAGGAIAFYHSTQGNALYSKRIRPTGTVAWTVQICPYTLGEVVAIPAHAGGAIVTWQDARAGSVTDIYAQKIDTSGAILWPRNGAAVVVWQAHQMYPQLVEDADGFVYFAWENALSDVYCQRLSPQGVQQFPPSGLIVCRAPDYQQFQKIVGDGVGGALFCWMDYRTLADIYATHLDSQGQIANPFWAWNGNPICDIPSHLNYQNYPQMVSDGSGGAVIAWDDSRGIYAQRVNDFVSMQEAATVLTSQNLPSLHSSPNPFNPTTALRFELREASHASLKIYDVAGKLVATLMDGWREAGVHEVTFDGSGLPSGIYLAHLQAGEFTAVQKLMLIK